jgi:adenylosuccinate synthase
MGSEAILVLGAQFGDEGKGKLIDIIAAERDIWYVAAIPNG